MMSFYMRYEPENFNLEIAPFFGKYRSFLIGIGKIIIDII